MERIIETKLSKVSRNLSLVLVNNIRLTTPEDLKLSVYPSEQSAKLAIMYFQNRNVPQNCLTRKLTSRNKISVPSQVLSAS